MDGCMDGYGWIGLSFKANPKPETDTEALNPEAQSSCDPASRSHQRQGAVWGTITPWQESVI